MPEIFAFFQATAHILEKTTFRQMESGDFRGYRWEFGGRKYAKYPPISPLPTPKPGKIDNVLLW
jgi:hypothetical protein